MKKVYTTALAAGLLLLAAGPANAGEKLKVRTTTPKTKEDKGGKPLNGVYLRSNVKSYNMGLLRPGDEFFKLGERNGYAFGYAYGEFKGCAFVSASYLTPTKLKFPYPPPGCGSMPGARSATAFEPMGADRLLDADPASVTPPRGVGGKLTAPVKIDPSCGQQQIKGNFRDGTYLTDQFLLPVEALVGYRYRTRSAGGVAAMVFFKVPSAKRSYWGFVPFRCLKPRS